MVVEGSRIKREVTLEPSEFSSGFKSENVILPRVVTHTVCSTRPDFAATMVLPQGWQCNGVVMNVLSSR